MFLFPVRRARLNTTVKAHWISEVVELVEKLDNFLLFYYYYYYYYYYFPGPSSTVRTRKRAANERRGYDTAGLLPSFA